MDVEHHRRQQPPSQGYHHHQNPHRQATAAAAAEAPTIPTRTRFNSTAAPAANSSRRRSGLSSLAPGSKRLSIPPSASPEVISNLITSLSGISKPADDYFEGKTGASTASTAGPSRSLPTSPAGGATGRAAPGSFGVDYGAFSRSNKGAPRKDSASLDEIAASAPVIRTSKPTSGFSPLAQPQQKSTRSSSRDTSTGGLRSFIRSNSSASRPSSNGSARNDDCHSIGNLSIEPGQPPEPDLHRRRSNDSWTKKASRTYKGLMYMSSRERLREKELERKRSGTSNNGMQDSGALGAGNTVQSPGKPDPFLAETAIREEPTGAAERTSDAPRPIPHRESSLRTSSVPKRPSNRRSKTEGNESAASKDAVPHTPDQSNRKRAAGKKVPARLDLEASSGKTFLLGPNEVAPSPSMPTPNTQRFLDTIRDDYLAFNGHTKATASAQDDSEAPAPFPSVSQNRRKSAQSADRRRSGANSPALGEDGRPKRSSSRLKRGSRTGSPTGEGVKASSEMRRDADAFGTNLERLDSADSIDDAVDAYLCSPRLTQKIRHPQTGRVICFSEVGDPEGSAVFCCVGMGLTRYITAFYDELALTLKLRLITPDRPGVGESEPYPDGSTTPLNWPDDVYAICQALKVTKFSILAHSAGAIYALATALRMPQHIRGRIHLLAPWIPPSQMSVFGGTQASPPTNAIPTSQRILRALPTPMLKVANSSFMSATSTSITTSLPKNSRRKRRSTGQTRDAAANKTASLAVDKENVDHGDYSRDNKADVRNGADPVAAAYGSQAHDYNTGNRMQAQGPALTSPADAVADQERQSTYDMRLTHAIWQLATTGANPAVDLLVCLERRHTIGFRYVDINRPVIIHHGSRDTRVPVDNVRWLGKTMRRCEVRVLEGEGHGLMASASVMGAVLMEISKEWEDWMRATGADGRKDRERGRSRTIGR